MSSGEQILSSFYPPDHRDVSLPIEKIVPAAIVVPRGQHKVHHAEADRGGWHARAGGRAGRVTVRGETGPGALFKLQA